MNIAKLSKLANTPTGLPKSEAEVGTPKNPVQKLSRYKQQAQDNVAAEIRRIVELPVIEHLTDEEVQLVSDHYLDPIEAPKYGFKTLFRPQAEGIAAYNDYAGAFLPITVGGGKTATAVCIANDAFKKGHKRILMLVPSSLVAQLTETDIPLFRKILRNFNLHVHTLSGVTAHRRNMMAKSKRVGLYVFSYELLSRSGGYEALEAIEPSCIICDEAHNIAGGRASARSKKFWEYVDKFNPELIALSGTITKKSVKDYHRIARACLKHNNFLPNAFNLAEAWGMLIDSSASSMSDFKNSDTPKAGPILPLIDWARRHFPKEEIKGGVVGFRHAYRLRLQCSPGVVSSASEDLGVSLSLENHEVPDYTKADGWDGVENLIDKLQNEWLTPNDDEIEHAMHIWKWRYEIEGAGFYNELFWPEAQKFADRRRIPLTEAEDIIERSKEYHEKHQEFARELRKWLQYNAKQGMFTPMEVGLSMHNHGARDVTEILYDTWKVMKEAEFEGRIDRDARAVRVSPFKVNHCADYVQEFKKKHKSEGMIVWYHNQEMGRWITEVLQDRGIETVHCAAGDQYNRAILDPHNKNKVVVASMKAHGTGKNLQAFGLEYYLQWPRDASLAEQSLGRIHRNGQKRDRVTAVLNLTTEFDRVTFAATLNDSCYNHQTTGNKQRLIYADYGFKPKLVPYTVLSEWGTMSKKLSAEGEAVLTGKFGE